MSVDRTTGASGRKVANAATGVLKNDQMLSEKSLLLSCDERSAASHTKIARVFNEAVQTLWPDVMKQDNTLLIITDATRT